MTHFLGLFVTLTLLVVSDRLFVDVNNFTELAVNSSLTSEVSDAVQLQHNKLRKARNVENHQDGHYIITMKSNKEQHNNS